LTVTANVPDVITRYFTAAEAGDDDALVACFTDDAEVSDEDRTWRGRADIRQWREDVATAYEYTLQVLGADPDGDDRYIVRTHLEGNFPGGKVDLAYRFTLRGGLISALEIAP
jgi:ketosteroid isomerase-like protein